jgi:predicted Zn-dependent protease
MNLQRFFSLLPILCLLMAAPACRKRDGGGGAERHWAEGKRLLDAGQLTEALVHLERAYARDATHEEGLVYLARALLQNQDARRASEILATYLAKHTGQAATWYMLALARYNERKRDAAVESLEEALHQRPRFPEAILLLGTIYEEYDETSAAIHAYHSIADDLALGPPLVPVLLRLTRLMQKDLAPEDEKKVEKHLLSAFQLAPREPAVLEALGTFHLDRKRPKEALGYFRLWEKHEPQSALAHHHLGLALALLGDHAGAVAAFDRAVAQDPDRIETYLSLADSLAALKQEDRLYDCLVAAAAAEPSNLVVKWRLLPFYIDKGRSQMAETLFAELEVERATDPEFYRLKTRFHVGRGEHRLAYESHMSRLTVSGRVDDAFSREAGILARQAGLYDKAVELLTPLGQAFPDDRRLHLELGLALWFSGKTAEGLAALRRLEPDRMARIWLAHLLLQSPGTAGQAGKTLQAAAAGLEEAPDEEKLFYYDVLTQQARLRKDWTGAVAALEKALALARHEEERNALELALEAAKKEIPHGKPR